MKKYLIYTLFILGITDLSAQRVSQHYQNRAKTIRDKKLKKDIVSDIRGNLLYEDSNGLKASLSKDIFDNRIYEDNRNNKISYSKEVWPYIFPDLEGDERKILLWLVDVLYDTQDSQEQYKRNIHGTLEYENSEGLRASFSKDIFDNQIYSDNYRNEIKYSKEFRQELLYDFNNNELQFFFWTMDRCYGLKNYNEEFSVDIFGYLQYKNNQRQKASLTTDIFKKKIYEDSTGNKIEYTKETWDKKVRRYGTEKKAFTALVYEYVLDIRYPQ